ncbi:MAG: acyl-CoA synthetase FdrA [Chloroflexi bacterium]|nr:acyl-CoA synthetase FdrA [Chloroflexota bacterium]MBP8056246.1 acyl-CoA synthetase FdrA [Chloroflexota bacterium]
MTATQSEIRAGAYYDSVVLMQLQKALAGLPGVVDAGVVMATPANLELLEAGGLLTPEAKTAKADDLLIVVKGEDAAAATHALSQVDQLLQRRRATTNQTFRPKSLSAAAKQLPQAQWVLISVPGRFAAGVARDALDLGKHVFLYSDNVTLTDEIQLKQTARDKGLLVMGPDCGTAIINGVGLGFANRVRRGRIGLVAASGTGLQAVSTHIHNLGGGISQAFGTGGRDLKADVGAITTHQGLQFLAHDPDTEVIVLISKPPAPQVVTGLVAAAQQINKPVIINFIGYPPPARQLGNVFFATTLAEAAELAVSREPLAAGKTANSQPPASSGYLRGLFSGGTLAYEAVLGLQAVLSPLFSNVPITAEQKLADPLVSQGHTILDLGEDIFTQGRLHPMMDNDLRLRRLRQEAADPETGLIWLDVVLGEGAHPDPAQELAPAIAVIKQDRPDLEVVVLIIGTDEDPQDVNRQMEAFAAADATLFRHPTEALLHITRHFLTNDQYTNTPITLSSPLSALNVGVESFHDSLIGQGAEALQVEWRPPAGGNEKLMALLAKMKR